MFHMKKLVLSAALLLGAGTTHALHAQAGALVNLIGLGARLGTQAALKHRAQPNAAEAGEAREKAAASTASQPAAQLAAAAPTELVRYRTPADKVPRKAAEPLTSLEGQLDRCHAALLASPTGPICSPEQRAAIQEAAVGVARAKPGFDLRPYQQEMAFYLAEDARRQQATPNPEPVK